MSAISTSAPAALVVEAEVPTESIYRLTVEQYHQMIQAGILVDGDPIELLEGLLVQKMTKNPPHVVATGLASDALSPMVGDGWHVHVQDPVTTLDSEPEPDIGVVRGKRRDYLKRHPKPKETALALEVADTSLRRDRGIKKRVYARAKIPVYWIVNLIERCIEVYTNPTGPGAKPDYRDRVVYGENAEVPVVLDGKEIGRLKVRDLLP